MYKKAFNYLKYVFAQQSQVTGRPGIWWMYNGNIYPFYEKTNSFREQLDPTLHSTKWEQLLQKMPRKDRAKAMYHNYATIHRGAVYHGKDNKFELQMPPEMYSDQGKIQKILDAFGISGEWNTSPEQRPWYIVQTPEHKTQKLNQQQKQENYQDNYFMLFGPPEEEEEFEGSIEGEMEEESEFASSVANNDPDFDFDNDNY